MLTRLTTSAHSGADDALVRTGPAPRPNRTTGGALRALVLRLHFYAGILVAPFILVASVSGGLYAIAPQLEAIHYASELRTDSVGDPLPLADQIDAALAVVDDSAALVAVRPAPGPGATSRVLFETDEETGDSERHAVFIDPVTGAVRGEQTVYGTSGALPLRTWIAQLHSGLHLGDLGRMYSELAASWLWVVALGGLVLWADRRRRLRGRGRDKPVLDRRGRLVGWHGAAGVLALAGMLGLAVTGLTWSVWAGANITEVRAAAGWTAPELATEMSGRVAGADSKPHHTGGSAGHDAVTSPSVRPADFDHVLGVARAAGVMASEVEVARPSRPGQAWSVTEIDLSWPVHADAVAVDPDTYEVVDEVRFAEFPFVAKLAKWGVAAHMGLLSGVPNQLALVALAALIAMIACWGYAMWWRRRPARGSRWAVGRPIPRGALRRTPAPLVAVLAVGAAAVGWFLPVLGVSLAGFLLLDVLVGRAWTRSASFRRSPTAS